MRARKVPSLSVYADPASAAWQAVAAEQVEMVPAPLDLQPTEYIQIAWDERSYGELESISARAIHDGASIGVHVSWLADKPGTDTNEGFPDAAAIALPVRGEPELMRMGSPEAPMQFVQWQASKKKARSVLATGIGSTVPGTPVGESARGSWSGGRWSVVFTRRLSGGNESANLVPGVDTLIGFAVWNSANEERAGIKAVCIDWVPLSIEA